MTSDNSLSTPFEVEQEMIELNQRIDAAPNVIREHHERVRTARREYKLQWALAYSNAEGNQLDRKAAADMETEDYLGDLDNAEIEYKYVVDVLDSLKTKLRALQSISSLMKAQMFTPQGGI